MNELSHVQLVSTIYDVPAGAASTTDVLRQLCHVLKSHYGASITTPPDRSAPRSLGSVGIDADDHAAFLRVWHKRNIFGQRRPTRASGAVIEARSIVPRSELLRSDIYNHYFKPREFGEGLRLDILHDPELSQSISLGRSWKAGAYDARELHFVRTIMPHLQRAATLTRRIRQVELMSSAAFAALDGLQSCVLLLDRVGRVLHMSAAAVALLRAADGLVSFGQGLAAETPADSARLGALLARAAGLAGQRPVSGTLRLARPSLRPALALIAMPLPSASELLPGGDPKVVLHVTDPVADFGPGSSELIGLFGLTVAEADLAAQLLKGMDAAEVARRTGRRLPTVRTHIANLMAKTHVQRQTDLVRPAHPACRARQSRVDPNSPGRATTAVCGARSVSTARTRNRPIRRALIKPDDDHCRRCAQQSGLMPMLTARRQSPRQMRRNC